MRTKLPDKWVRKAIFDLINNMSVSGKTIPCFDTNTVNYKGNYYVIMSTQTNVENSNKCKHGWRATILLDVFTRHKKNHGSRVLAEDIVDEIMERLIGFNLDPASEMRIHSINISTPNDISQKIDGEIIHRKFLRYELYIN